MIAVRLIDDLWLEMPLDDAIQYSKQRQQVLGDQLKGIQKQISTVLQRQDVLEQGIDALADELVRLQTV